MIAMAGFGPDGGGGGGIFLGDAVGGAARVAEDEDCDCELEAAAEDVAEGSSSDAK